MKLRIELLIVFALGIIMALSPGVAAAKSLLVVRGDESYPPMEIMNGDKLTGFHIELVNAAAKQLGLKITYKSVPWKRAINMVKESQADAITYISRSQERDQFVCFLEGNILSSNRNNFIMLKENQAKVTWKGDLKDITPHTILTIRGYVYGGDFDTASFLKKYECDSQDELISMLNANREIIGIVNTDDYVKVIKGKNLSDKFSILEPPISMIHNYIGFSQKNKKLAEQFAQALDEFKTTEAYQALKRNYEVQ